MCGLACSFPVFAVAKKFSLSASSRTACDQKTFGMFVADAIAVLAAAMSCRNLLSANAFDWLAFGAVCVVPVPLLSRNRRRSLVSCSLAPSVWSLFALRSQIR
eukprot:Plantae.Rhodophyta-Palmaria_palmata.ctg7837.p2 GENE.Plantae.Rhodophyta-Palmaria_palmata.ctg7837~~Plantae.Rhodophyta-Palmaria_palmata.ctg7837.p2  ORF type:complete len:103 (-),score=11.07 Plantae.Rhodophyta-Palmaria_palmata.ctg7837:330-638(-)